MNDSLPFEQPSVISVVGAGGKTSLMFYLARMLPGSVITTTTTKVGYDQIKAADRSLTFDQFMSDPESCLKTRVNWVSRELDESQRKISGFSPMEFRWLAAVALPLGLTIINEADGAHCRHIKAPSVFEPVVPEETTHVLSLVGLDTIGLEINDENVHRSELFCEITGTAPGMMLTEEIILKAYGHPQGGFKNAPLLARKIAVLNRADSEERKAIGARIAARLLADGVDEVWLSSLKAEDPRILARMTREELQ